MKTVNRETLCRTETFNELWVVDSGPFYQLSKTDGIVTSGNSGVIVM